MTRPRPRRPRRPTGIPRRRPRGRVRSAAPQTESTSLARPPSTRWTDEVSGHREFSAVDHENFRNLNHGFRRARLLCAANVRAWLSSRHPPPREQARVNLRRLRPGSALRVGGRSNGRGVQAFLRCRPPPWRLVPLRRRAGVHTSQIVRTHAGGSKEGGRRPGRRTFRIRVGFKSRPKVDL